MKNKKDIAPIDVAYFSMEFALSSDIPNYAGGLGVLAADMMYSATDLGLQAVGVSLIYHQNDDPKLAFPLAKYLQRCPETIEVKIESRVVKVAIWKKEIKSGRHRLPIYFLSTYLPENERWDRDLTKNLYSDNAYTRLCQETLLGVGGVRALEALGYTDIRRYHMNEGHCSLLTLELLKKNNYDENKVRSLCSFTTHTPIASGHDYFDYDLAYRTIGDVLTWDIRQLAGNDRLGMTQLGLALSAKANAVSRRHTQVCREMFPDHKFESITNGVYHPHWAGRHMRNLLDENFPDWRERPEVLADAPSRLADKELLRARRREKEDLVEWINSNPEFFPFRDVTDEDYFSEDVLTIGFARRFVPYKRPELIFRQAEALRNIGNKKLQLVFAGHCGPTDNFCNNIMHTIEDYTQKFRGEIKVALVPDYKLDIAFRLVSGCDVWLNTPIPPREASGTSGMKAALNGCLNLSIPDGWWVEGIKKYPASGWAFGSRTASLDEVCRDDEDAKDLIAKLQNVIYCYYEKKEEWTERMKYSIALLSYFNTHRVVREYCEKMWNVENASITDEVD
ncbi:MAG: alpha-glucan family phosphorylase [Candidatus Pacebacteria bacterium]|nr:alpha-glucan family phosphorylase [Candidatus Paceibacterota bacterium]MDR3582981.1 alpha-glucan family phosphorylase [Candidatus Paceibacterota bacterium]